MTSIVRGVYTLPYLSETGNTLIVAINSRGHRIGFREVMPGDNPYDVVAELWIELNAMDPVPRVIQRAG